MQSTLCGYIQGIVLELKLARHLLYSKVISFDGMAKQNLLFFKISAYSMVHEIAEANTGHEPIQLNV